MTLVRRLRVLDRLDVMRAAAVPLRADLGAARSGEAIDFALAPSKRWVSVPSAQISIPQVIPMFYEAACEVHHNISHVLPTDGGKDLKSIGNYWTGPA